MTKRYFISDAHFGSGFGNEQQRSDLLNAFADTISGTDAELYILGDFFDFWIEYSNVIRTEYTPVITALYNISRSGIPITIVRGNHDFMDHSYFAKMMNATILDGHTSIDMDGISVHLCHGDDLAGDWKYRALHLFLRNKIAQRLYKLLHPAFGITFATSMSGVSRKHSTKTGRYLSDERQNWYHSRVNRLLKESNDSLLIMGHTHRPDISTLENGTYANSGTWLNKPTVLILHKKKLLLTEFTPSGNEPFTIEKSVEL